MRLQWLTAVIGGIDSRHLDKHQVTEHEYKRVWLNAPWLPEHIELNARTQALYYKTQPHIIAEEYFDAFIWTDGKVEILAPDFIDQMVEVLHDKEIAILKHGARSCVYQEIDYIEREMRRGSQYLRARYAHRQLALQAKAYKAIGYPAWNGLNDCSIFIARNSEKARELLDRWWLAVSDQVQFDQTVIQVEAWKMGIDIGSIELKPNTFRLVKHNIIC